jgi:hypothetical protein
MNHAAPSLHFFPFITTAEDPGHEVSHSVDLAAKTGLSTPQRCSLGDTPTVELAAPGRRPGIALPRPKRSLSQQPPRLSESRLTPSDFAILGVVQLGVTVSR